MIIDWTYGSVDPAVVLGWPGVWNWSVNRVIRGPYCVEAGEVFTAGTVIGELFVATTVIGEMFVAGAETGQVSCN